MPRTPSRRSVSRLRPLNHPLGVRVQADEAGRPVRIRGRREWRNVVAVHEHWRIDDEWWRTPISRAYFAVVLEGGRPVTLYHDLMTDRWYVQNV